MLQIIPLYYLHLPYDIYLLCLHVCGSDYGYTNSNDILQPQRFATLLLYLNEPEAGGETTFPRWINAETREALKAKPQRGKAVLFYSFLPDGNMDDLSQHSAAPVIDGEKWMINLWGKR